MRMKRLLAVLFLAMLVAPSLAACGKKGSPIPPAGEGASYPRQYPSK